MTRKYTLKPSPADPRDFLYAAKLGAASAALPPSIDLRAKMAPVVDQGQLGSCTANAMASGMREYYLNRDGIPDVGLSRLYLYYKERELEGTVTEDAGAFIRDGLKVLQQTGVCPEINWPYDTSKFAVKPSDAADQAAGYKIDAYHRVQSLDELKAALENGEPVVLGIAVYSSFESFDTSCGGIVPMPDTTKEKMLGGHAILAVGYDDSKKWVIVRNSWGTNWGDHGYCYIPYDFISNPALTFEMWVGEVSKPVPPYEKITTDEALSILAGKGVIDSPDFWHNLATKYAGDPNSDFRYVDLLVRKVAVALKG